MSNIPPSHMQPTASFTCKWLHKDALGVLVMHPQRCERTKSHHRQTHRLSHMWPSKNAVSCLVIRLESFSVYTRDLQSEKVKCILLPNQAGIYERRRSNFSLSCSCFYPDWFPSWVLLFAISFLPTKQGKDLPIHLAIHLAICTMVVVKCTRLFDSLLYLTLFLFFL